MEIFLKAVEMPLGTISRTVIFSKVFIRGKMCVYLYTHACPSLTAKPGSGGIIVQGLNDILYKQTQCHLLLLPVASGSIMFYDN